MSAAAAVYLGVALLLWGPCMLRTKRFISGTLISIAWPVALPLIVTAWAARRAGDVGSVTPAPSAARRTPVGAAR
jgi:hypothetical protein